MGSAISDEVKKVLKRYEELTASAAAASAAASVSYPTVTPSIPFEPFWKDAYSVSADTPKSLILLKEDIEWIKARESEFKEFRKVYEADRDALLSVIKELEAKIEKLSSH